MLLKGERRTGVFEVGLITAGLLGMLGDFRGGGGSLSGCDEVELWRLGRTSISPSALAVLCQGNKKRHYPNVNNNLCHHAALNFAI